MKSKLILIVLGIVMLLCGCMKREAKLPELQHGDLLFSIVPPHASGLASAIADVTCDSHQLQVSHVAIVCREGREVFALEAAPQRGVVLTPIDSFMRQADVTPDGRPYVVLARLCDSTGVAKSVERAKRYLGTPYDSLYMPDDSAIYCSELVQLSYRRADGSPIFEQIPMSFHDETGRVTDFWTEHYKRYNLPVPEGEPGTNPGGVLRSDKLSVVRAFYAKPAADQ